jgi:hypothetical protein
VREDGGVETSFVTEVVVRRGNIRARAAADALDRRPAEAVAGEDLERRIEQPLPGSVRPSFGACHSIANFKWKFD